MGDLKAETLEPRVLLSWPIPPDYIPPPIFSSRQVTLCPEEIAKGLGFSYITTSEDLVESPLGDYDIYEFAQESNRIKDKDFDLVIVWSSVFSSRVLGTKKFGCPTVLLAGDTHHGRLLGSSIQLTEHYLSNFLSYCRQEDFDYVVTPHNRHHLHWFAATGFKNVAWLPLISMRTIAHEWIENKEKKVAFLGHLSPIHPRRCFLVGALKQLELPLVVKQGSREEAAHLFAHSLISLNCSLNGDINFRNFEIISAGGFLLTDRLSFASGFDEYLVPGLYCDVYSSLSELIEKIKFYLENHELAIEMAKRAHEKFFSEWHPKYRVANLMDWVFKGELPDFYKGRSEIRFFMSTSHSDLIDTRLAIYEQVQDLHQFQEQLKVLVSQSCPPVIVADLLDLPRLQLYVESGFAISDLPNDERILARIQVMDSDCCFKEKWDVLIIKRNDQLTSYGSAFISKFVFILGNKNEIVFSNMIKPRST
ncbi:glycosyltransferase [Synechococcus sp. OH2]|uniref:glycosyltransferase n=1 Tax=Synechococcus sp. OH2 TaxID=136798 RepID=UPI0039C0EED1